MERGDGYRPAIAGLSDGVTVYELDEHLRQRVIPHIGAVNLSGTFLVNGKEAGFSILALLKDSVYRLDGALAGCQGGVPSGGQESVLCGGEVVEVPDDA